MRKYVCEVCGWVYDEAEGAPEMGIEPGTEFEDLPDDFGLLKPLLIPLYSKIRISPPQSSS